ncbi:MAG: CBS domain-containing protein, partial [Candidatus Competibacteraceae bacterium]|nr:CBS domain-containing protein [Candidatus Competibacteraceae bacterium]
MLPAPVLLGPATPIATVVERLCASSSSAAIVVNEQGQPLGILTERDICRRVTFRADGQAPVAAFMSTPVQTIDA